VPASCACSRFTCQVKTRRTPAMPNRTSSAPLPPNHSTRPPHYPTITEERRAFASGGATATMGSSPTRYGPIVQRPGHRTFDPATGVRFPVGSPDRRRPERCTCSGLQAFPRRWFPLGLTPRRCPGRRRGLARPSWGEWCRPGGGPRVARSAAVCIRRRDGP
jgi:hypothetical protein